MLSRRGFLTGLLAVPAGAVPAFAQGDPVTQGVLRQLEAQGFAIIDVQRTLLGRVRITAIRGDLQRELVLDPRNCLVLRDLALRGGDGPGVPDIADYDDDDDEHDDDEDDGDDDGDDDDNEDTDDGSGDDDDDD